MTILCLVGLLGDTGLVVSSHYLVHCVGLQYSIVAVPLTRREVSSILGVHSSCIGLFTLM